MLIYMYTEKKNLSRTKRKRKCEYLYRDHNCKFYNLIYFFCNKKICFYYHRNNYCDITGCSTMPE